jgi:hypothetical protein
MLEIKLVLLLTLREFDFIPAYDDKDPSAGEEYGGQAYQVTGLGPAPSKGLPMRAKKTRW